MRSNDRRAGVGTPGADDWAMSDTTKIIPPPQRGTRWIDLILAALAGALLTLLLIGVLLSGGVARFAGSSASPSPSASSAPSPSVTIQIRTVAPTSEAPSPTPRPTLSSTPSAAPTTAAPTVAPTSAAPTPSRTNTPAPTKTP
jgi:hypothetical protein